MSNAVLLEAVVDGNTSLELPWVDTFYLPLINVEFCFYFSAR